MVAPHASGVCDNHTMIEPAELVRMYNAMEPYIWYSFAAVVLAAQGLGTRRQRLVLALLLVVFGTSDFFESESWWTPWWLLGWKAGALGGIISVAALMWRHRAAGRSPSEARPSCSCS
jgi:hypothetical protein